MKKALEAAVAGFLLHLLSSYSTLISLSTEMCPNIKLLAACGGSKTTCWPQSNDLRGKGSGRWGGGEVGGWRRTFVWVRFCPSSFLAIAAGFRVKCRPEAVAAWPCGKVRGQHWSRVLRPVMQHWNRPFTSVTCS